MSQQEQRNQQIQDIQDTIAAIEKGFLCLEQLIHDYKVFCNRTFPMVVHASGEDFQQSWKQDRDALRQRAKDLLGDDA